MSEETPAKPELQGGIGSQILLWVLAISALGAGFATLKSSDNEVAGAMLVGMGSLSVLLALTVQAIRGALK